MRRHLLLALASAILSVAAATENGPTPIRRVADIRTVTWKEAKPPGRLFELEGRILSPHTLHGGLYGGHHVRFTLEDETGADMLQSYLTDTNLVFHCGDRVRVKGRVIVEHGGIYAHCEDLTVVGHRAPKSPVPATIDDLIAGKYDYRHVIVQGEVSDVFPDEIDPNWLYLIVSEGEKTVYIPCRRERVDANPENLIGCRIEATGQYVLGYDIGMRQNMGRIFNDVTSLRVIRLPKYGPYDVPELEDCRLLMPEDIPTLGRRRVRGTVLAVWQKDSVLLKTSDERLMRLDLASSPPPPAGSVIEAVGIPVSDLYRVNLTRVRWRPRAEPPDAPERPIDIAIRQLFVNAEGRRRFNPEFFGRRIRFDGLVRGLPSAASPESRIFLESDGFLLPIDASACPDAVRSLEEGCCVRIVGTCITDIDNWQSNAPFTVIRGFTVVIGSPDDITVTVRPPWWTPKRLMVLIAGLIAVLGAIFIWNRLLTRKVERRSRQLLEEQIAHVTSDLKTMERTRLAIELHDSLAQNLTGVALELQTVKELVRDETDSAVSHLETVDRSLRSCREELRNCLRDLRSEALETDDVNEAIRLTLDPHAAGADVSIRFNVSRDKLTDNTMHALLRIIRELVLNAIRHGHATAIKVAGAIENGKLLFSVSDNGCGFDVNNHPGIREGHFGLQGVHDRIRGFEGEMEIRSDPGRGTKVTLALTLPKEDLSCRR